jgi:hypothetical protein
MSVLGWILIEAIILLVALGMLSYALVEKVNRLK